MAAAGAGILARKLAKPKIPEGATAPAPTRGLRKAVARASRDVFGSEIDVIGVEIGESGLDDLVAGLGAAHCLIGLEGSQGQAGFVVVDAEVLAAAGEIMTTGRVKPSPADARSPTEVDAALLGPFLSGLIASIQRDCSDSPPGDWFGSIFLGSRIAGALALCLALPERSYRVLRMTIDLGAGGRQGEIAFALPNPISSTLDQSKRRSSPDWSTRMGEVVMQTQTEVEAILGRVRLPLASAEAFRVGQVLPLLELDIATVSLEAPDGSKIANCRLGQSGGMRAVRVEPRPDLALEESGHFRPPQVRPPEQIGLEADNPARADQES